MTNGNHMTMFYTVVKGNKCNGIKAPLVNEDDLSLWRLVISRSSYMNLKEVHTLYWEFIKRIDVKKANKLVESSYWDKKVVIAEGNFDLDRKFYYTNGKIKPKYSEFDYLQSVRDKQKKIQGRKNL